MAHEIHHGRSRIAETAFLVNRDDTSEILGCRNHDHSIWGTYIHGVFDSTPFRQYILNNIRKRKQLPVPEKQPDFSIDSELSRLAGILRESVDMNSIYQLLERKR